MDEGSFLKSTLQILLAVCEELFLENALEVKRQGFGTESAFCLMPDRGCCCCTCEALNQT